MMGWSSWATRLHQPTGGGLASEATRGMIKYAFAHPEVGRVDAHTLPEKNASTGVLEKVGMKFMGAFMTRRMGSLALESGPQRLPASRIGTYVIWLPINYRLNRRIPRPQTLAHCGPQYTISLLDSFQSSFVNGAPLMR